MCVSHKHLCGVGDKKTIFFFWRLLDRIERKNHIFPKFGINPQVILVGKITLAVLLCTWSLNEVLNTCRFVSTSMHVLIMRCSISGKWITIRNAMRNTYKARQEKNDKWLKRMQMVLPFFRQMSSLSTFHLFILYQHVF
jgi:hypothetical protein